MHTGVSKEEKGRLPAPKVHHQVIPLKHLPGRTLQFPQGTLTGEPGIYLTQALLPSSWLTTDHSAAALVEECTF